MPNYDENIDHDNHSRPDWRLFLRGFKAAFFRTKLWVCTWLVLLLLSLVPAFQTASFFQNTVGSRYPSAELAQDLHSSMGAPSMGLGAARLERRQRRGRPRAHRVPVRRLRRRGVAPGHLRAA
jgi:hypothetical protein